MGRRIARGCLYLLACIGFIVLTVMATPLTFCWSTVLSGVWTEARGDVLIVLGGSVLSEDVIGQDTYLRSVYAVRAWREGGFRKILLSGGGPGPVSERMRDFLLAHGVPGEVILLETNSQSTRENALFTARMLGSTPGTKVLMTSDYHMYRAWRAFRKAGLDVLPRPIPDGRKRFSTWHKRMELAVDLTVESIKALGYAVKGWI